MRSTPRASTTPPSWIDPAEIQLPAVTQSQVNSPIDLKFYTLLRSCLRQDPAVIVIGGIRDLETARIATECVLTGHPGRLQASPL